MADLEEQNLIYGLHTSNAQLKSNPKAISKIYIKKQPHNNQLKNILELANKGIEVALDENIHLKNGLNTQDGKIMHPAVDEALNK